MKTPCEEQFRIRTFPRIAVTDRKEFKSEINVKWPCNPAVKCSEQVKSSTGFCCPSPVKFGVAIPICKIDIYSLSRITGETFCVLKLRRYLLPL